MRNGVFRSADLPHIIGELWNTEDRPVAGYKYEYTCPKCETNLEFMKRVTLTKRSCPQCGKPITPEEIDRQQQMKRLRTGAVPEGAQKPGQNSLVLGGCLVMVVGVVIIAAMFGGRRERERNGADQAKATEKGNKQVAEMPVVPGEQVKPRTPTQTHPDPEPAVTAPEPPKVGIAPPPRRIDPSFPPPGFASDWVRIGGIRTRVAGVKVGPAWLADQNGREFRSPDTVLTIWVETESVNASGVTMRRWINPVTTFARLQTTSGIAIPHTTFSPGLRVAGQLERGRQLLPGGSGIVDVLVFEKPRIGAGALVLRLSA
jgi:hypothetical protein